MNLVHHLLCGSAFWRRALQEEIVPWALEGVSLGEDLLELGPGPGLTTALLQALTRNPARLRSISLWLPVWPIV